MNAPIRGETVELSIEHRETVAAVMAEAAVQRRLAPKIVAVFGLGSYGDALQITPLLHHLKLRFEGARIVLIHASGAVPGLLLPSGVADCVLSTGSSQMFPALRSGLIREGLADLIVNCRYVVEYSLPEAGGLSGPERDFVRQAQAEQRHWLGFTQSFPHDNDQLWREAAGRGLNAYSLMALTAGFGTADFEDLRLALNPEDFRIRESLPRRYFVVCNSAEPLAAARSTWTKTLPGAKISDIVARIGALGIPAVLLGIADDPPVGGVEYDLRGRSSLREAAAIVKESCFWLAPEGGVANLGQAVGRPGIVFFGPTPPEFFAYGRNAAVVPKACGGCWWTTASYLYHCPRLLTVPECMGSIDGDEIVGLAERMAS